MKLSTSRWIAGGTLGGIGLLMGYEYLQYRKRKALFYGPGAHAERGHKKHERGEYGGGEGRGGHGHHHHHDEDR